MKNCYHCSQPIYKAVKIDSIEGKKDNDKVFCCYGCRFVYQALSENKLSDYYQYKDSQSARVNTVDLEQTYQYLDHKDYQKEFFEIGEDSIKAQFYVEGVHCLACLWLFEKLSEINSNIISSKLNMTTSLLELVIKKEASLAKIAKDISHFGYKVQAIEKNNREQIQNTERKKDINRIALAFFGMGNIMLLSFSIYSGAEGFFKDYFHWISFIISLPVMLYSARPFYQTTLAAIKQKRFSIDIPITTALVIGYLGGIIGLFIKTETIYFDSLVMLVFLLLLSRFILKEIKLSLTNRMSKLNFFSNVITHKVENDTLIDVHARFINKGDKIKVLSGEIIPVDGEIIEGRTYLDNSIINGESRLEKVEVGERVISGALNKSDPIMIKALDSFEDSLLGKMLGELNKDIGIENQYAKDALRWAKFFLILSFVLSAFVFISVRPLDLAFERVIAIIIITCPCALGLIVPLTMIIGIGRLKERGIFVKSEQSIQKLSKIKHVFLDKTGTLTNKSFEFQIRPLKKNQDYFLEVLYLMEQKSKHPIAIEYCSQFFLEPKFELDSFVESAKGIEAQVGENTYKIRSDRNSDHTAFYLLENNQEALHITVKMSTRFDAYRLIKYLKHKNLEVNLLSGDNKMKVEDFASQLGIKLKNTYSQVSPIDKKTIISENKNVLMIGDGVNDTLAMQCADLSIAVNTSVDFAQRSADIYLAKDDLGLIEALFEIANKIMQTLSRNILLSSLLNISFILLALNDYITPFGAAILMPMSSLIMLVHTLISLNIKKAKEIRKTDNYHIFKDGLSLS